MTVHVIVTGKGRLREVDQMTDNSRAVGREVKWLKAQGHDVSVKRFASWDLANAFEDSLKGY